MLRRIFGLTIAFALIVTASYVGNTIFSSKPLPAAAAEPVADLDEIDRLIEVFSTRAPSRGESLEFRQLGSLFTIRAEATGDLAEYRNAVNAYAEAVEIAPDAAVNQLALGQTLLTLHEFAAARSIADDLVLAEPADFEIRAFAADAALETGDLATAAGHLTVLEELEPRAPAITVRRANMAYLTGRPDDARRLAAAALDQASSLPAIDQAFFYSFAGSVAFLTGDLDASHRYHETAAQLTPWDQGALGELARVEAARGNHDEAIALLERANEIQPEPDHLTRLADLYVLTEGASPEVVEQLFAEGVALATQDDDYRRAWARLHAQFLLDHERNLDEALRIAEVDLAGRQDAGAWDLYAWALFHHGRYDEARVASDRALANGIENAAYLYHAGSISAALGDTDRAVDELQRALDLNPGFEPVHAAIAAALLEDLKGS